MQRAKEYKKDRMRTYLTLTYNLLGLKHSHMVFQEFLSN